MAPECFGFLKGEFTAKSDIYSFGVVIRQILMGWKTASTTETVRRC
jgi:serine/threonine protein kinase